MSQPLPSQSAEDYLERIHALIEEKGYARVVDIASSLEVKQASVTSMVQKLGELGYLNYEKYRGLILTEKGRTPRKVSVFAPWNVAAEEGDWIGTWTEPDGSLRLGGSYQAQWRLIEGRWLIQGELFVPLHCEGGAYCLHHP